jgi:hypothetical protein
MKALRGMLAFHPRNHILWATRRMAPRPDDKLLGRLEMPESSDLSTREKSLPKSWILLSESNDEPRLLGRLIVLYGSTGALAEAALPGWLLSELSSWASPLLPVDSMTM